MRAAGRQGSSMERAVSPTAEKNTTMGSGQTIKSMVLAFTPSPEALTMEHGHATAARGRAVSSWPVERSSRGPSRTTNS
jgi:hypothetical protein